MSLHSFAATTVAITAVFSAALSLSAAPVVEAVTDKPDAIYKAGETATVKMLLRDDKSNEILSGKKVRYEIIADEETVASGEFVTSTEPKVLTGTINRPGWLRFSFTLLDQNGKEMFQERKSGTRSYKVKAGGGIGAMFDPLNLRNHQTEPADFDAFWAAQRAALNKVPLKATRQSQPTKLSKALHGKVELFDFKVDCAGNAPVSGYLAIPVGAKPRSLPAIVSFHGAGVRSSSPGIALIAVKDQCITADVNAHGIENGRENSYYADLDRGILKTYRTGQSDNRDTVYFKNMYLRVMRTLDYIKSLPEWDGKNLIVRGGSQGGAQTIVAAALDHDVTFAFAGVPALSEHSAWAETPARVPGWPRFHYSAAPRAKTTEADRPKILERQKKVDQAVAYFDNIYFAKRIKCPIMLSTGFMDTTCSPSSVYVVFNNLPVKDKKIFTSPTGTHSTSAKMVYTECSKYLKSIR